MANEKEVDEMTLEELEEYENSLDKKIKVNSIKDKVKSLEPKSLMPQSGERKRTYSGNSDIDWQDKYTNWYEDYKETHDDVATQNTLKFFDYFTNTDSDTGCEDIVGEWSPADNYAKKVWATAVCDSKLLDVCVKGLEINAGDGLGVQIRLAGKIAAPQAKGSCECGSCASISFSTYPLTITQYNLEAVVCKKDSFDVGDALMESYVTAMKNSWAEFFDSEIWGDLYGATPGFDQTLDNALQCSTPSLDSATCCQDKALYDMWNACNSAIATMHEGTGLAQPYNPDTIIMSPSVAKLFKRQQTPTPVFYSDVKFDDSGRLTRLCGLKVIEYCGATSCSDASDLTVAIIIDSSRAVGCVFGEEPKMYSKFQTDCNSVRLDWWAFIAFGALDLDAICHICNP